MIFRPELVGLILKGEKTMTRRPAKLGEEQCRYRPGRSYAVQSGRGKKATCRMRVLETRLEEAGAITDGDARLEGFDDRDGFLEYWRDLYGEEAPLDRLVWVIRFEVDRDRPLRYMAKQAGKVSPAQYVADPSQAIDDVPAPDDDDLEGFRRDAERAEAARRQKRLAGLHEQLRAAWERAARAGVDVSLQERAIERQIRVIERKARRAA